jgi:PAS domain S-box-containing protein
MLTRRNSLADRRRTRRKAVKPHRFPDLPENAPAPLREMREELEVERLALEAEHQALAEAQRAAEATRTEYTEMYDFGLIGMATFDLRGHILNINATGAALLGRQGLHMRDKPFVALLARDHRKWFAYLRRVQASDREVKVELYIRRAEHAEVLLEFTGVVTRSRYQKEILIRTAFRDVTAQRATEAAARRAKADLNFVADYAPVSLARCSRDLRYLFVNEAYAELLQRSRKEILGRSIVEVLGEAAFAAKVPYIQRVLQGETVQYEAEVPYDRAGLHYIHVVYRPERDELGEVTGWLAAISDITERRRAEKAQQESEERFRQMADSAPVLIWVAGTDKLCTYFNKPWLDFTGRTMEQELGNGWAASVHPDDLRRCVDTYTESFDRREEFKMEYRLRRHDGQYRWVLDHGVPRFASAHEFAGYIGSCVDITERKEAERMLRETRDTLEQRVAERTGELQAEVLIRKAAEHASRELAAIVESSVDAIVSYNLDGMVVSWNKGAERFYGYTAAEALGRPASAMQPPEQREEFAQAVKRIRQGRTVEPFETVCRGKDGQRIDLLLQLSPIKDRHGRVTGFSHIARDISAGKLAEKALRESEGRLLAITDHCPALIFLKDLKGRYLHVNRQFGEVFRLETATTLGKTDAELFSAKQAAAFRANDLRVMAAKAPLIFDEVVEQANGPHISVVTRFPLFDSQGEIYALGGVITDVTERRRLEEEILRISEREQRRIAQDLHDGLGQRLAGVSFMTDVLRKNLVASGSHQSAQAGKISRLLNASVAETRGLARGLHPVEEQPHGLMSALSDLAASVTHMFKIRCRFLCPEPVMLGDNSTATHLYRITQEAVSNAIRHGQARQVEIVLSAVKKKVTLVVRDNGVGMRKANNGKAGMGLRIMDYRAQMIGGNVEIRPRIPSGTEVNCTLPRENSPP